MTADLRELLTEENLRRLIAHGSIGEDPPWRERFGPKNRSRVVAVIDRLRSRDTLRVDGKPFMGYASFADLFVYPASGATTTTRGEAAEIRGLQLYVAMRAPIAFYGASSITRSARSRGSTMLDPSHPIRVEPALRFVEAAVCKALAEAGVHLLARDHAQELLRFEAEIATNLASPPYRVFDAIFQWRD